MLLVVIIVILTHHILTCHIHVIVPWQNKDYYCYFYYYNYFPDIASPKIHAKLLHPSYFFKFIIANVIYLVLYVCKGKTYTCFFLYFLVFLLLGWLLVILSRCFSDRAPHPMQQNWPCILPKNWCNFCKNHKLSFSCFCFSVLRTNLWMCGYVELLVVTFSWEQYLVYLVYSLHYYYTSAFQLFKSPTQKTTGDALLLKSYKKDVTHLWSHNC